MIVAERDLKRAIRLALRDVPGLVLYNNPVGVARYDGGAQVRYGLTPGASDLIGWLNGRFVALETKSARGKISADQHSFVALARLHGGLAGFAYTVADAYDILEIHSDDQRSHPC